MAVLRLSWLALRRDWRSGELRLLALALLVAVAAATAVSFFTDRIRMATEIHAGELLAADLVIQSPDPLAQDLEEEAARRGLAAARTLSFRSVVSHGDALQLSELKAVEAPYPLRGRLQIADTPFGDPRTVEQGPAAGTVWLDPRLMQALAVTVGDTVEVGASPLVVAAVLAFEPDRGGDLFSIAPRLMMNLADIPATGLLLPGSRVSHALLLGGERQAVAEFRDWAHPRLSPGERILGVREGRPELKAALDRAEQFLGLAALVAILLAGVAIATSARRYAERHLDTAAVMRCLGATQGRVVATFGLEMLWLALAAGLAGCLLGYLAQGGLAALLADLIPGRLPPPSAAPWIGGMMVSLVALLGFAIPPLLKLRNVPPGRVLRRDLGPGQGTPWLIYGAALAALVVLAPWDRGELRLTLYVLGGVLASIALLGFGAWLLVRALGGLRSRVGVAWRYGFANITRRSRSSVVQTVALGLGIMVMLLLSLVRTDLLEGWQASLPAGAPNHFLINIQPAEVDALGQLLEERGVGDALLYPMVRGRLVAVNGEPVSPEDYPDGRPRRLVDREFNVSWLARPLHDNRVVRGRWWSPAEHGQPLLSVETGIAETLGWSMGDALTFRIADREFTGYVTNLRTVQWDSFNVNFFVVAPPQTLSDYPATFITAFHLPAQMRPLLAEIVQQFPSVTVIDVAALMDHVRRIMDQVTLAVEFVFGFTLVAGLAVLYAAIQATHDARVREAGVLRALGASHRRVRQGLLAEFLALGLLAGLLAAAAAGLTGWLLAVQVFEIPYRFNPWLLPAGLLAGGLGIGLAGLIGTRGVLRQSPLAVLRRS